MPHEISVLYKSLKKLAYTHGLNLDPMRTMRINCLRPKLLGWVTVPNTWFPGAPYHFGPPNHSMGIQVTGYFKPTMWEIGASLLKVFTFEKRQCLQGPSNSCDTHFAITYRVRPTQRWSNTIIHAGGIIEVISSLHIKSEVNCIWLACLRPFKVFYLERR